MKASCDELKIYTINPKTTTKVKQQRVIANKPRREIKRSHKKHSTNPKAAEKDEKEIKTET